MVVSCRHLLKKIGNGHKYVYVMSYNDLYWLAYAFGDYGGH